LGEKDPAIRRGPIKNANEKELSQEDLKITTSDAGKERSTFRRVGKYGYRQSRGWGEEMITEVRPPIKAKIP